MVLGFSLATEHHPAERGAPYGPSRRDQSSGWPGWFQAWPSSWLERGTSVMLLEQQHFPLAQTLRRITSLLVTEESSAPWHPRRGAATAGAVPIQEGSASATSTGESLRRRSLPGTALGAEPRYALDKILWDRASEGRSPLPDRTPVTASGQAWTNGFVVSTARSSVTG